MLRSILSFRIPILQAPMAGGVDNPLLVSAVANAGGIGSFGFAYSSPDVILQRLTEARKLTDGIINSNFFVFNPPNTKTTEDDINSALRFINSFVPRFDIPPLTANIIKEPYYPDLSEQLDAVFSATKPPDVVSFHFGIPDANVIERAKLKGIKVGISATCLHEASQIQRSGADFVIAQGSEAGGDGNGGQRD